MSYIPYPSRGGAVFSLGRFLQMNELLVANRATEWLRSTRKKNCYLRAFFYRKAGKQGISQGVRCHGSPAAPDRFLHSA